MLFSTVVLSILIARTASYNPEPTTVPTSYLVHFQTVNGNFQTTALFNSILQNNSKFSKFIWIIFTNASDQNKPQTPVLDKFPFRTIGIVEEGSSCESQKVNKIIRKISSGYRNKKDFTLIIIRTDPQLKCRNVFPQIVWSIPRTFIHFVGISEANHQKLQIFPNGYFCHGCRQTLQWLPRDTESTPFYDKILPYPEVNSVLVSASLGFVNFADLAQYFVDREDWACLKPIRERWAISNSFRKNGSLFLCAMRSMATVVLANHFNFSLRYASSSVATFSVKIAIEFPSPQSIDKELIDHQLFDSFKTIQAVYCHFSMCGISAKNSQDCTNNRLLLWFHPFGKDVWLALLLSWTFLAGVLCGMSLLKYDVKSRWNLMLDSIFAASLQPLFRQENLTFSSFQARFKLCLLLTFMSYVVSNYYENIITSQIIAQPSIPPYDNVSTLISQGYSIAYYVTNNSDGVPEPYPELDVVTNFFTRNHIPLEKLRQLFFENWTLLSDWMTCYLDKFGNPADKLACLEPNEGYLSNVANYYQQFMSAAVEDYTCMMTKESIFGEPEFWFIRSPLKAQLSNFLNKLYTHGLAKHWVELSEHEQKQAWKVINIIENRVGNPTIGLSQVVALMQGCGVIFVFTFSVLLVELANY